MCHRIRFQRSFFNIPDLPPGFFVRLVTQNSRGQEVDTVFIRYGKEGERQRNLEISRKAMSFELFSRKLKYWFGRCYESPSVGRLLLQEYSNLYSKDHALVWAAMFCYKEDRWIGSMENIMLHDYIWSKPVGSRVEFLRPSSGTRI